MEFYELALGIACAVPAYYFIWNLGRPTKADLKAEKMWKQRQCSTGNHEDWGPVFWMQFKHAKVQIRRCNDCSLNQAFLDGKWQVYEEGMEQLEKPRQNRRYS
jgi:hypothetical protein